MFHVKHPLARFGGKQGSTNGRIVQRRSDTNRRQSGAQGFLESVADQRNMLEDTS